MTQLQHLLVCTQFGLTYGLEFNKMYRIHVILILSIFFSFSLVLILILLEQKPVG